MGFHFIALRSVSLHLWVILAIAENGDADHLRICFKRLVKAVAATDTKLTSLAFGFLAERVDVLENLDVILGKLIVAALVNSRSIGLCTALKVLTRRGARAS